MITLLWAVFDKFKLWLALAGGVLLAIGVAGLRGYAAGKAAQKAAQAKAIEKSRQRVQKNRIDAGSASEAELDRALEKWAEGADEWSRD